MMVWLETPPSHQGVSTRTCLRETERGDVCKEMPRIVGDEDKMTRESRSGDDGGRSCRRRRNISGLEKGGRGWIRKGKVNKNCLNSCE
jgi:hypothetical protein